MSETKESEVSHRAHRNSAPATDAEPGGGRAVGTAAKVGIVGVLMIVAAGAILGMGLFMFNMGRVMTMMT